MSSDNKKVKEVINVAFYLILAYCLLMGFSILAIATSVIQIAKY